MCRPRTRRLDDRSLRFRQFRAGPALPAGSAPVGSAAAGPVTGGLVSETPLYFVLAPPLMRRTQIHDESSSSWQCHTSQGASCRTPDRGGGSGSARATARDEGRKHGGAATMRGEAEAWHMSRRTWRGGSEKKTPNPSGSCVDRCAAQMRGIRNAVQLGFEKKDVGTRSRCTVAWVAS